MTDPDLVFDMDPQNVRRVEQWISDRWPERMLGKQADGSRLTWVLQGADRIATVVATESFLSMPPADVDRHLEDARRVCEERPSQSRGHLVLATDGPRVVDGF